MCTLPKFPGSFLDLPTELRYTIYKYLSINEPICYPFPSSPITSISHGAPPRQLLLTCRKLYDDVKSYYYGRATFRLMALSSSRIKRADMSFGSLTAIRQAKKVELMLIWNFTLERANSNPKTLPWSMNGWIGEQAALLKDEGHMLELVTLSLRDESSSGTWAMRENLLASLKTIKGKVRFEVGEIITVQVDEEGVRKNFEKYVEDLNE